MEPLSHSSKNILCFCSRANTDSFTYLKVCRARLFSVDGGFPRSAAEDSKPEGESECISKCLGKLCRGVTRATAHPVFIHWIGLHKRHWAPTQIHLSPFTKTDADAQLHLSISERALCVFCTLKGLRTKTTDSFPQPFFSRMLQDIRLSL